MNKESVRRQATALLTFVTLCLSVMLASAWNPSCTNYITSSWDKQVDPQLLCGCETNTVPPGQVASFTVKDNTPVSFMLATLANVPPGYLVANGPYVGWCADYFHDISVMQTYTPIMYSSLCPLPVDLQSPNWAKVNFILNHKQGNSIDIQNAIWYFIGGPVPTSDTLYYPMKAAASNMIAQALACGDGFLPGPGDIFAVILDVGLPTQLTFIEVPCVVPCVQLCPGSSFTNKVDLCGTGSFSLQWYKNGSPILGKTNSTLVLTNLAVGDSAQYCVGVTGDCNSVTNCMCLIVTGTNGNPPVITKCIPDTNVQCYADVPAAATSLADFLLKGGLLQNPAGATVSLLSQTAVTNGGCAITVTRIYQAQTLAPCGGTATCTNIIYVRDTTPPVITLSPPGFQTNFQCFADYQAAPPIIAHVVDNCDGTNVILTAISAISGSCPTRISICWTATDHCSNSASVCVGITIHDTIPPIIRCPSNITLGCGSNALPCAANLAQFFAMGGFASDNCDTNLQYFCFDGPQIGNQIVRTHTVCDDCTNCASCTQIITLSSNSTPTICCPPSLTLCCATAVPTPATNNAGFIAQGGSISGGVVVWMGDTLKSSNCLNQFVIQRTYKVADVCSNSAVCLQTITVNDMTPPALLCLPSKTVECGTPWSFDVPSASDNCVFDTLVFDDSVNDLRVRFNPGTNEVGDEIILEGMSRDVSSFIFEYYGTNATQAGFVGAVKARVRFYRNDGPLSAGYPTPGTVLYDSGPFGVVATTRATMAISDFVTGAVVPLTTVVPDSFTWTVQFSGLGSGDEAGVDLYSPPVVGGDFPDYWQRTGASWALKTNSVPVDFAARLMATHGKVIVTLVATVTNALCDSTYVASRTWRATDACGNSTNCTQTVAVVDRTPPTIICTNETLTIECDTLPDPTITGIPTVSDNCSTNVSLTFNDHTVPLSDISPVFCPEDRVIVRTWIAMDACSNRATCVQHIYQLDTKPPVFTFCPTNLTLQCTEPTDPTRTGIATARDNCDPKFKLTYSDVVLPGACPEAKTIMRTWTAIDDCGNSTNCQQVITVVDTVPPIIVCPTDATIDCTAPIDPGHTGWATASDNCAPVFSISIKYSDTFATGACPVVQVITRIWKATDDCQNASTCTQHISKVDFTPPLLHCPVDVTLECSTNLLLDPAITGQGTASDTCDPNVKITYSDRALAVGCLTNGRILRTWTAMDACSNSASCLQNIYIVDTLPPVVQVPPRIFIGCTDSDSPTNTGFATAIDKCSGTNVALKFVDNRSPLGCGGSTLIVRTWTATDCSGNTDSEDQYIFKLEKGPPVFTFFPTNTTIQCDKPYDPSHTGSALATDTCSGNDALVAYTDTVLDAGICPVKATVLRKWVAVDDCGNRSNRTQTITLVDTTPPIIACPVDLTIECTDPIDPNHTGLATGSDNCDPVFKFAYSDSVVVTTNCPQRKVITRTWWAWDDCLNTNTCAQKITIVDTTPPQIACPLDVTVECTASLDPLNTGQAVAFDLCDPTVVPTFSDRTVTNGCPLRVISRTWTVKDACGNSNTCRQTITVMDTKPPVITCPTNVTIQCTESTDPTVNLKLGKAAVTDNCDTNPVVTFGDTSLPGNCPEKEIISRTWTARDECGNVASCVQLISVVDTVPPVFTFCPTNQTLQCTEPTDPTRTGFATATDNCDPKFSLTYSDVVLSTNNCPEAKTIIRTWVATDDCLNSTNCVQVITVVDTIPPIIACPVDLTIECTDPIDPAHTGVATASDNCDPVFNIGSRYVDSVAPSTNCPARKVITRTWYAWDDCRNTNTCVQKITIVDTVPPVITCPVDITAECTASLDPTFTGLATATDTCDGTNVVVTFSDRTLTNGCPVRVISRTWTARDSCTNVATCRQTITLVDTRPPVVTCPTNVTIQCTDSLNPNVNAKLGKATATDNCDTNPVVTFSDSISSGTCPEIMTITRTWTARDECGNVASCSQFISVVDTTPPVITFCPTNITLQCLEPTDPSRTGFATATDNCDPLFSITWSDVVTPGNCPGTKTIVRTWKATDDCLNTTNCTQVISVVDTNPPVLVCPVNVTIDCLEATNAAHTGVATAYDACSGSNVVVAFSDSVVTSNCPLSVITRTWTATDPCANRASCVQTITVVIQEPPVFVFCPTNVTVPCGSPTDTNTLGVPVVTSICGGVLTATNIDTIMPGVCPTNKVIARLWVARDVCGNSNTCVQVIRVVDNQPPLITNAPPTNVVISCGTSLDPTNTGGRVLATDACSSNFVTFGDLIISNQCPQVVKRTWTAQDLCGNQTNYVQIITVVDTNPPVFAFCPPDITLSCTNSTIPVFTGMPVVTDRCDVAISVIHTDLLARASCPRVIQRTWIAWDDCLNTNYCFQKITVVDTNPPTIICPADLSLASLDQLATLTNCFGCRAQAYDDCDVHPTVQLISSATNFVCEFVGDTVVLARITNVWQATDACTNRSFCQQVITITNLSARGVDVPQPCIGTNTFPQFLPGTNLIITACATGIPPITVVWQRGGTNITNPRFGQVFNGCSVSNGISTCCWSLIITNWQASDQGADYTATFVFAPPIQACLAIPPQLFTVPTPVLRCQTFGQEVFPLCEGGSYTSCILGNLYPTNILGPLHYQWYKKVGPTLQLLAGETNYCITIGNINCSTTNDYVAIVYNDFVAETNAIFRLVPLSGIVASEMTQVGGQCGSNVTFCIDAQFAWLLPPGNCPTNITTCPGVPPPLGVPCDAILYQWYKDGVPIAGETNSCYTRFNTTPGDAGQYCVRAVGIHYNVPATYLLPDGTQTNTLVTYNCGSATRCTNLVFGCSMDFTKTVNLPADSGCIFPFQPVVYTYTVTNTGCQTLSNIVVTDDNGTPGYASDDFVVFTLSGLPPHFAAVSMVTNIPPVALCSTYGPAGVIEVDVLTNGNIKATFIQDFGINDNTYGLNAIGWGGPNNHKFSDLTASDHVDWEFRNGNGTVVLHFGEDYISQLQQPNPSYPSGYASLGFGGDGSAPTIGNPANVLAFSSSLAENLNKPPFVNNLIQYAVNSPSFADPNAMLWEFRQTYSVVISSAAFGPSGFGSAAIVAQHNSPAKRTFTPNPAPCCGNVTNTAVVTTQCGTNTLTLSDTAAVCICTNATPRICVTKSCVNANGVVTYTGTVSNCGSITLTNVLVFDDGSSVPTTKVFGPLTLLPNQSTNFSGSYACASCTTNTVLVRGTGTNGVAVTNIATVPCSSTTRLCVTKEIACLLPGDQCDVFGPTATGYKGDTGLPAFCYRITVSNCGSNSVTVLSVSDDKLGDLTSFFFPIANTILPVNGLVTRIFKASWATTTTNTVVATGQSTVNGQIISSLPASAIAFVDTARIICQSSVTSPDDQDGNPSDAHVTLPADNLAHLVTFQLRVCNTGHVDLAGVTISSPELLTKGCSLPPPFALPVGGCFLYVCTVSLRCSDVPLLATYAVTARVATDSNHCGYDTNGAPITVNSSCRAIVDCRPPCQLLVTKTACIISSGGGCSTVFATPDCVPVTYTYVISNVGGVTATNVTVIDDQLGPVPGSPIASLAPGQSVTLTATHTVCCTVTNSVTVSANGGQCPAVTAQAVVKKCAPLGVCTPPYPFDSANPLTSIPFNESEVLRAFTVSVTNGCLPQQIRVYFNDERALVLGVRQVVVKSSSGTTTQNYPVTPLLSSPDSAINPQVGATDLVGDQAGTDLSGRPLFPALFVTDITSDPNSLAGDWQYGGTAIPPHAVFGTWKAAVRVVDNTHNPPVVTVTPDANPTKNDWNLDGGDPAPAGLTDQGFGAEVRWDVDKLGLLPGHTYRLYFMVHDGDQNKQGGDVGQGCATLGVGTSVDCRPSCPTCELGYPFNSSNPRTSIAFNESEVLRGFSTNVAGPGDTIKVWYSDERALSLGVRRVIVKTSSGTTTTDYPVTPLNNNPGSALNPAVGTTADSGDQAGTDLDGRPIFPSLFITDTTSDPNSRAGDWQFGGTPIPPHAVFGTWKGVVRTVDNTHIPPAVTITPEADPAQNGWNLDGGDPAPAGLVNQGYGAELRWNISDLGLLGGHRYRLQVMVHDGDQNKTGGDVGEACINLCIPGNNLPLCVTKEIACIVPGGTPASPNCTPFGKVATGFKGDSQDPAFCYQITVSNCSDILLTNLVVTDDELAGIAAHFPSFLAPHDFVQIHLMMPWGATTTNTVKASARSMDMTQSAFGSDSAVAVVLPAALTCQKFAFSPDDLDNDPNNDTVVLPDDGQSHPVTFSVTVSNPNDASLINVTISDPILQNLGCVMPAPFSLPPHTSANFVLCSQMLSCPIVSQSMTSGSGNPLLGAAADCAVLQLGNGKVDMTGPAGGILGNVCIGPSGQLKMSGDQFVSGNIELAAGASIKNSSHGSIGLVLQDVDLNAALDDAYSASEDAAVMPCTQNFGTLDTTRTITGNGGKNVICVQNIVLNGGNIIYLHGTASDVFIINVSGKFTLSGGSKILVQGGVLPGNVLFNIMGKGSDVALNGGGGGANCCNARVDGSLLAVQRKIALSPGLVNGAVISAQNISIVSGSSVRSSETQQLFNIVTVTATIDAGSSAGCAFDTSGKPVTVQSTCAAKIQCGNPPASRECSSGIVAFKVKYIGATRSGPTTITFTGVASSAISVTYDLPGGLATGTVLTMSSEGGWTIDATQHGGSKLGTRTSVYINGGLAEILHTSCSCRMNNFVPGLPACLDATSPDNPTTTKGEPSPLWLVLDFK